MRVISNEPITQTTYPTSNLFFGTTFSIGLDHHKSIKSNFEFISGVNFSKVENPNFPVRMQLSSTTDFSYGVGGSFGIFYKVSENFSIGSSINPIIIFTRSPNAT
ncbi:MAG: hypothetical protein PHW82_05910 [Bacteroidales bacterium]|nr:hypothetical protein [Bacteroidales bacterium]